LTDWHWGCQTCGYEKATLQPVINNADAQAQIDETVRAQALRGLREASFRQLLDWIAHDLPSHTSDTPPRLLDVGAGQGWFARLAREQCDVTGIEPDDAARAIAQDNGVALRVGFFPDCLTPQERFDAIVFNDSLEHLPDPGAMLGAARAHLQPGGLVVVNLPNSRGVLYRIARTLRRAGLRGPFERLWQVGLPSPHLHYFDPDNLARLAAAQGLDVIRRARLDSLRYRGLYARIAYARPGKAASSVFIWLALLPLVAILRALPGDIMVLTLRSRP
jgi:2-polyprenyl-3-methyl-5-hydroxy-6-metoxy-1,4-benzoquinol methylase